MRISFLTDLVLTSPLLSDRYVENRDAEEVKKNNNNNIKSTNSSCHTDATMLS